MRPAPPQRETITGAVLAGGAGRRMGGLDKGLVLLNGRALVAWALDALRPQTGRLVINANRSLDQYRDFSVPVVRDSGAGFQGPLAGMHAVLAAATTEFVLTVPCDAPWVPADLAQRLGRAMTRTDAEIAVARSDGRLHPVHALLRSDLADDLAAALVAGEREVKRWQAAGHRLAVADCDDIAAAFVNINTAQQLEALQS